MFAFAMSLVCLCRAHALSFFLHCNLGLHSLSFISRRLSIDLGGNFRVLDSIKLNVTRHSNSRFDNANYDLPAPQIVSTPLAFSSCIAPLSTFVMKLETIVSFKAILVDAGTSQSSS
jgi:hypothetical protein